MSTIIAERLLKSFGVREPEEIDLDAIAWSLGVLSVKVRELDGCEARIVGKGDHAIISVDHRAIPRRRRFSIAHELGHWVHHRGKTSFCRHEDIQERQTGTVMEQQANRFAADLILPNYLLVPLARRVPKMTVKSLRELADRFQTTMTATAIRLVESNLFPVMLVSYGVNGRRWFAASKMVPSRWFPNSELHHDTYAFDLLNRRGTEQPNPRKIGADAFFDRREAERFEIDEQSFAVAENEIVTILHFRDDSMLEDL